MLADRTTPKLRLVGGTEYYPVDIARASNCPLPGEQDFPSPPAMPASLLQLQLCLSASVVDLHDIANITLSDPGLTLQLLRLAARETGQSTDAIAIGEIVVQLGIQKLRALIAQTQPVPAHLKRPAGLSACERFWAHSRLTALIAEELAGQSSQCGSEITPEEAYLAGLLCRVGQLPTILGWAEDDPGSGESPCIGYRMAKAWKLPIFLANLIGSYGETTLIGESPALLHLVETADNWAQRIESLTASQTTRSESLVI